MSINNATIPYLQIGNGRLGNAIIQAIQAEPSLSSLLANTFNSTFRITPEAGLTLVCSSASPLVIDKLLICIAPGIDKKWSWNDIFQGLVRQVQQKQLMINELIFISSTRVYDGISYGVVTAQDKPNPCSDRAKGLLTAERQLAQLADTHCFLRCCGLIGQKYQRFQEILKQPDDKLRFAVDIEHVAEKVVERLLINQLFDQHSIVTDGYCYYRGERLSFGQSLHLSSENRLLQNSDWINDSLFK